MGDPLESAKAAAARYAIGRLAPGAVALGTGSTASWAVRAIAERFPKGRGFEFVCSSRATEELARSLELPVRSLREDDRFTTMIDGADEVSDALDLTKGGGGALLREKLLAGLSEELIIVVDPTKLVRRLGEKAAIPVEVVPFARPVLTERFRTQGYGVQLRTTSDGRPFVTDNTGATRVGRRGRDRIVPCDGPPGRDRPAGRSGGGAGRSGLGTSPLKRPARRGVANRRRTRCGHAGQVCSDPDR
jgi:ribose 5-phosphate isomerase A